MDQNKLPSEMTFEEIIEFREKLNTQKEEIEAALSVLSDEIINRFKIEKVNGMVVGNIAITKVSRTVFEVTLEQAKDLGAIIMKEVVDNDALKKLHALGVKVPFRITEYVTIKEIKNGNED